MQCGYQQSKLHHEKKKVMAEDPISKDIAGFFVKTIEEAENQLFNKELPGKLHTHNFYLILWANEAFGTHQIDDITYDFGCNSFHLVPPGQNHQLIFVNEEPTGIYLMFTTEFLNQHIGGSSFLSDTNLFSKSTRKHPLIQIENSKEIAQFQLLMKELRKESAESDEFNTERTAALIRLLLIDLSRQRQTNLHHNLSALSPQVRLVRDFKKLVELYFRSQHQLGYYAHKLAITPNYLNEIIHQTSGDSAKAMIARRLMIEARRLAIFGERPMREVAHQLGFTDTDHFSKFFKKAQDEPFAEYRNRVHQMVT